ncbi:MAG: tRNA pseudouridine(55) synthase TruB [Mariniblastus sp.]|nr:tRNA pseudouridine(55) synthase TruB [Mariniblastus sp.]
MFGFLNVAKPVGQTSRRVVDRVQQLLNRVKVGHTGTLDPLASGVLVLAVGPATRLAKYLLHHSKHYRADFRLGCSSSTDDLEGELNYLESAPVVSRDQLQAALLDFTGAIRQRPPDFSAVKVNGQRAYRLARKGKTVELSERNVTIHELELQCFDYPDFQLSVHCSGGTYVRSLGRDLGRHVGSAAVMTALSRTRIGDFSLSQSLDYEELERAVIEANLVSPVMALPGMPRTVVAASTIQKLRHGTLVDLDETADLVAAVDSEQRLMAVMVRREDGQYSPGTNFVHYWEEHGYQSSESS